MSDTSWLTTFFQLQEDANEAHSKNMGKVSEEYAKAAKDLRQNQDEQSKLAIEGTQELAKAVAKGYVERTVTSRAPDMGPISEYYNSSSKNNLTGVAGHVFGDFIGATGASFIESYSDIQAYYRKGGNSAWIDHIANKSINGSIATSPSRLIDAKDLGLRSDAQELKVAETLTYIVNVEGEGSPKYRQYLEAIKSLSGSQRASYIKNQHSNWEDKDSKRKADEGGWSIVREGLSWAERMGFNLAGALSPYSYGESSESSLYKNSSPSNSLRQPEESLWQSQTGMSPFARGASRLNAGRQQQFNGLVNFGGQSGILSGLQGASQGFSMFGSMAQGGGLMGGMGLGGGLMGGMFSKGASALGSLTDANDDPFAGMKDSLQDLSGMFTNTFVDGLIEGKMNFKDLADSVIKDIGRMLLKKGMMKMLGSFGGGAGGAAGSGLLGAIGGMFGFADGGIFADGNVTPASDVKRFTNTVATSPTTAPMALFGEAGPEAIMPLSRGADGKLGVKASGGGNSSSIVYSPVIQVDSRADRAQVMADVNKVVQASSAQLIDRIKRNPRMIEA